MSAPKLSTVYILKNLKIQDIEIIGQSKEKEVIFCYHKESRRILFFDQHAVHERIRFEKILLEEGSVDNLELTKSRACHGAIRFGDKLTLDECHQLIVQVLGCRVPFRCAHARRSVSMSGSLDVILYQIPQK